MPNTRKPRSPRPDPAPDTFAARVRDTMHRLNLDEREAADYLGVPIYTLRKWESGERGSSAAVMRLLDVLGMVEALAPAPTPGHVLVRLNAGGAPLLARVTQRSARALNLAPGMTVFAQIKAVALLD